MDPSSALKELSLRASRFSINLNGQIDLDNLHDPLHGSSALVHRGVLRRDGTKVAVKTFHNGPPGDINALKRILREVHLWSKLNHENVVCMLGISTDFGSTISIVSDWLALGDAHTYVQDRDNDPRPLLMDIASGLHYLHTHTLGPIFHGDLKGPNVLISDARRALLTDFGFSTLTKSTFTMTISLPRGGSLPWMAPERLDDYDASAESDIWAFGMTMLELFTRLAPFHDSPYTGSIMRRLLQGKLPVRPTEESSCFRMTNAWWDICSSCWQREPMSRPTITEVKHEMMELMHRPPSMFSSGGPMPSPPLARQKTDASFESSKSLLPSLSPSFSWLQSPNLPLYQVKQVLRGHTDKVLSVAFSPDGRWVVSGSADNKIYLWDAHRGIQTRHHFQGHRNWVRSVAFSPDGKWIVSGSYDKTICLWDAHNGVQICPPLKGHTAKVLSVVVSPDGKTIISGSSDRTIRLWDIKDHLQIGSPLTGHSGPVQSVAFSPEGRQVVSGSHDRTVQLWDAQSGAQVGAPLTGHTGMVWSVSFSPDGTRIVSGSEDKSLCLWDAQTGVQLSGSPLRGHTGGVNVVTFSPDGKWIASGSVDSSICLWNAYTGMQMGPPLKANVGWIRSVAFSPDGKQIVSGSEDGTICLWNVHA